MGDSVERALEETVPVLQAAKRAKLLSSQEIDQVVRKRRNHEYALKKQNASRSEYLKYASFERELSNLLQKRADKRKIKKKTVQLIVGNTSSRVNLVYSRAVKAFRGDADLWLHYAKHCVKTGTTRTAQKVLARAIAYRGDCERVWLAAIALHFDTCGDAKGARQLAQRALRAIPHSVVLWKEYFRLELSYLSKLIIRRLAIGLSASPEPQEKETTQKSLHANGANARKPASPQSAGDSHETKSASSSEDTREISAKDSITEGHAADVEIQEKRIKSSESESSGEESVSESEASMSDLSTDEDTNEDIGQTESLSFWEGGVPMTVFKKACDSVNLTAEVLREFWIIASSSPYIPPLFLQTMSKHISKRFPGRVVSRIIKARVDWDCARSEYQRGRGRDSEKNSSLGNPSPDSDSDKSKEVLDASTKVPSRLRSVLRDEEIPRLSDLERNAALECVRDVEAILKRSRITRKVTEELKALFILFDQNKVDMNAKVPKMNGNDETAELKPESWSLATLEHAIAQGKAESGDWKYGNVLSGVKHKAGVPFRDVHHDKVVRDFFGIETDITAVREVADLLLSTPPVTMEGIRCAIAAEMRILDESGLPSHSVLPEETKTRLRRLFAKCETLPGARHDVDFWLLFLDFERRKAKDARATSAVHAKALRILTSEKVALFTELHSLRNLD